MRMRILGRTGLQVSELCLGTGSFGGLGEYKASGEVGQKEADIIISTALDAGINFFNTAEIYSGGLAEKIFGKALGDRRKEAIIITKVHPTRGTGSNQGGHSRKHIIEACDASLKRIGTDYIDIFELHAFDTETPLEITLRALDDLIRAGKIRYFGCSNFSGWQVMKGLSISDMHGWDRFVTLEAMYSLCNRWLEFELIPLCLDQGIAVLPFSPLHGGFLSGKYRRNNPWPSGTRFSSPENTQPWPVKLDQLYDIVDQLDLIAKSHNVNISQTALNYLLQKPGVNSLIIGVRNIQQLKENLPATGWQMTQEEITRLDKVSEPERLYPYYVYDPIKADMEKLEQQRKKNEKVAFN
jgi:aryl-alcohol dehydrogenase-like predicted oxidoreductase